MELYIVFFMIIAVALIVLAIYITRVEHLAVTNRTRIGSLEKGSSEQYAYNKSKLIEENKSLSFQLAEVSKELQEKKLLIYEMDEKLSKLDAELGQANLRLESQKNTILAYQGRDKSGMYLEEKLKMCRVALEQVRTFLSAKKPTRLQENAVASNVKYVLSHFPDMRTERVSIDDALPLKTEAPKYGKSPVYEALKSIDDSNNNRRWMGVDFGNGPDQSATSFIQEGEELKGFNIHPVAWDMLKSKPLIDAEFVTQDYGESERVQELQNGFGTPNSIMEELHDHSGSDPIFEADATEADTAANLEFEPAFTYKSTQQLAFEWWANLGSDNVNKLKRKYGHKIEGAVSDEELICIYELEAPTDNLESNYVFRDEVNISTPHDPTKCPDCQRGERFYNQYGENGPSEETDCFTCNGNGLVDEPDTSGEPIPKFKYVSSARKRYGSKTSPIAQNLPEQSEQKTALKWWNGLSDFERDACVEKYCNLKYKFSIPENVKQIYDLEKGTQDENIDGRV